MAYNPIEYLKQGNIDFVDKLTTYDRENLIARIRKSSEKEEIIDGCIEKLKDSKYSYKFILEVVYDMDKYKEQIFYILKKHKCCYIINQDFRKVGNILYKTSFGKEYVIANLEEIINSDFNSLHIIIAFIFSDFSNNQDLVKKLYLHSNLHIRATFMKYVIDNHKDKLNVIYDDVMKYLTSYTHKEFEQITFLPELMTEKDISSLALSALNSNDKELWLKLKQFILENYKYNNLAEGLLKERKISEFESDADKLFLTSRNYQFEIYKQYTKYISESLYKDFRYYMSMFKNESINGRYSYDYYLGNLFSKGLGHDLKEYIDKYLSLSTDTTCEFVEKGSTTACYRIGDYAFKISQTKWSYEDIICPNLYLILKNLEEHFIRDNTNTVVAGLEIQKYLRRSANHLPEEVFANFKKELNGLGYYITDTLINGSCGDNCRLLDSYMDADCINPESLPESFKKIPLVLVDRDRVYKLDNIYPKQR